MIQTVRCHIRLMTENVRPLDDFHLKDLYLSQWISFYFSYTSCGAGAMMALMGVRSRPLTKLSTLKLGLHGFKKPNISTQPQRTLITAAQRRRVTTVARGPLSYSVVDHHYEYIVCLL